MVECTALEMRRALTGTVGSNPTLSAMVRLYSITNWPQPSKQPATVWYVLARPCAIWCAGMAATIVHPAACGAISGPVDGLSRLFYGTRLSEVGRLTLGVRLRPAPTRMTAQPSSRDTEINPSCSRLCDLRTDGHGSRLPDAGLRLGKRVVSGVLWRCRRSFFRGACNFSAKTV